MPHLKQFLFTSPPLHLSGCLSWRVSHEEQTTVATVHPAAIDSRLLAELFKHTWLRFLTEDWIEEHWRAHLTEVFKTLSRVIRVWLPSPSVGKAPRWESSVLSAPQIDAEPTEGADYQRLLLTQELGLRLISSGLWHSTQSPLMIMVHKGISQHSFKPITHFIFFFFFFPCGLICRWTFMCWGRGGERVHWQK